MVEHLDDIESDMSAFHRIDDIWTMEAGKFFRYAYRLPAYQGAMRARAERQAMDEEKRNGGRSRDVVPVGSGELGKIEGLGHGITRNTGDGNVWISVEKATD